MISRAADQKHALIRGDATILIGDKLPKPPAYVSPVKPLPVPAKANGTTGMAVAEDWNAF